MGSPVSVVFRNCDVEHRGTLPFDLQIILLWLRQIDDTITAIRHNEFDALHHRLGQQNTDIQSTRGVEENGKLPFLDFLVSRDDNFIWTTVNRTPRHTDRLLHESSYNLTSNKATTIRTPTRQAQQACNGTDSLSDENKYLHHVFY